MHHNAPQQTAANAHTPTTILLRLIQMAQPLHSSAIWRNNGCALAGIPSSEDKLLQTSEDAMKTQPYKEISCKGFFDPLHERKQFLPRLGTGSPLCSAFDRRSDGWRRRHCVGDSTSNAPGMHVVLAWHVTDRSELLDGGRDYSACLLTSVHCKSIYKG